jgi:hypothetical protein
MLKTDFVVRAITERFVHGMTAAAQRKLFFITSDYISLWIDELNLPFDADGPVFQYFDYDVRHMICSSSNGLKSAMPNARRGGRSSY